MLGYWQMTQILAQSSLYAVAFAAALEGFVGALITMACENAMELSGYSCSHDLPRLRRSDLAVSVLRVRLQYAETMAQERRVVTVRLVGDAFELVVPKQKGHFSAKMALPQFSDVVQPCSGHRRWTIQTILQLSDQ
jgi:hypothetical protein